MLPLNQLPPEILQSERLKLCLIKIGDARLIFDLYCCDPVATKFMSFACTRNFEDTFQYVRDSVLYSQGKPSPVAAYTWLIAMKDSGQPIGTAGFGPKNQSTLSGGYILNQKFWGRGYATEAWGCLMEWAKAQPGVRRIEAYHHPDNPASGKVMQKCGMLCEGLSKEHSIYPNLGDNLRDAVIYAWER